MLSQTRQPGFSGPGTLRLSDIITLYNAQGWVEADIELMQYVRTMLFLDGVLRQYYEERKPSGR
jgi:hypothetical protein